MWQRHGNYRGGDCSALCYAVQYRCKEPKDPGVHYHHNGGKDGDWFNSCGDKGCHAGASYSWQRFGVRSELPGILDDMWRDMLLQHPRGGNR